MISQSQNSAEQVRITNFKWTKKMFVFLRKDDSICTGSVSAASILNMNWEESLVIY